MGLMSQESKRPTGCNKGLADAASLALRWIDDGFKLEKVDPETSALRLLICEACTDHFIKEERRCDVCCCPMDFKVTLKYDPIKGIVRKTKVACPLEKW